MGIKKHSIKDNRYNDSSVKITHKGMPKKKKYKIKDREDNKTIANWFKRSR